MQFFLAMFETFFLCDKYLASFAYADGRDYGVYDLKKNSCTSKIRCWILTGF